MTPKDNNISAPEDDYSLEEILAEYGGSLELTCSGKPDRRKHLPRSLRPARPGRRKRPRSLSRRPPKPRTPSGRLRGRRRQTWPG